MELCGPGFEGIAVLQRRHFGDTDFTNALIEGVNFYNTTAKGFQAAQLYSTASYQAGSLMGVDLSSNNLDAWDFTNQDLTGGVFRDSNIGRCRLFRGCRA